jgi:HlyD family secretion protein
VRIDAYPNKTFEGRVTEVGGSPIVKTTGATEAIKFKVKVQLNEPPPDVKPGLSVQVEIQTGARDKALTVPIQALVMRDVPKTGASPAPGAPKDEEGVYVIAGGKVQFRKIETGLMGEMSVEVKTGLSGGEQLVTGPFRALRELKDGDTVKVEEPKKDGPKAG